MSVQSLQIMIHSTRQVYQRATQGFNDHWADNIHRIPLSLLEIMPNVESFDLEINPTSQSFPFFSVDGLFHGKDLRFSFERCGVIPQKDIRIPSSVQKLVLLCNSDLIRSLSSNSVKCLSWVIDRRQKNPNIGIKGNMLDLSLWKYLEHIETHGGVVQWSKGSLAFLRRVSIWGHPRIAGLYIYNVATSFIRDLACSPESYPSLEEIKLNEHPEWDILVIMLERRNLLARPSIRRITRLPLSFLSTPNSPNTLRPSSRQVATEAIQ
ncbi:hypothetical protein CPB86DRAFT_878621 [Serendipita vermifera]|nr:hypothetical protein CPB86DRAFT_878621 [Serendipita vermifera]